MEQDFGVCRLSLVPLLYEPANSRQVGQLLFGEAYEVIDRSHDNLWLRIKINFDKVEGWINRNHHHSIALEYFEHIIQADFKITTDVVASILYKKNPLSILIGSIVPISSSELFKMDQQLAFNGESKSISQKREAEFLKSVALKYLNAPEIEGGKNPFGICANGLVQMVFKISGYPLPWDLQHQAESGKKVSDIFSANVGDIAFFKDQNNNLVHTGIILGDDKVIHAFGQVKIDYINEEGILNPETKVYSHTLAKIRRLLP